MAYVYAYAPNATDCTGIGLVGGLMPTMCEFNIKAGDFGELTLEHPVDELGKWKALDYGAIIRCPVPVRICPAIDEANAYVTTIYKYRVSYSATTEQRTLYKGSSNDNKQAVKVLSHNKIVSLISYNSDRSKYKVSAKIGKKKYTGWIDSNALVESTEPAESIPASVNGFEQAESSYAVKDQLFRVFQVDRIDRGNAPYVSVRALRIAYDLNGNSTKYYVKEAVTGAAAARAILSNTRLKNHGFTVYSDVANERIGVDVRNQSVVQALCDPSTGIAGLFGAQVISDDYDIYMLHSAGMDRGLRIAYGKNLQGITCSVDASSVFEGIMPYGSGENDEGYVYLSTTALPSSESGMTFEWRYDDGTPCFDPDASTVNHSVVYLSGLHTNPRKIYTVKVDDAKVDKTNGVTITDVRSRLRQYVKETFLSGAYAPSISLDVDFTMLGDTEEYAQFKSLDDLFIYDTVQISHRMLGISSQCQVSEITWDVLQGRIISAHLGSLLDVAATVSGYQIKGLSGSSIMPGTVNSMQLADDCIETKHLQSNTINARLIQSDAITADKIQANAVTATKISSGAVTTEKLAAHAVEADQINVNSLTANDEFKTNVGTIATAKIRDADIGYAQIKDLSASSLITKDAVADKYFIDKLQVRNLQVVEQTCGSLILKASDGNYYRLDIDAYAAQPSLVAVQVSPSATEIANGVTSDGTRSIIETSITAQDLAASTIKGINALIDQIAADRIDVNQLFVREAFISALSTSLIYGGKSFKLLVEDTEIAQNAATEADGKAEIVNSNFHRAIRFDAANGLHIGDNQTSNEVLIDSESVNIVMGGQKYSKFAANYVQFGRYQLRQSADGGLVFKVKEE